MKLFLTVSSPIRNLVFTGLILFVSFHSQGGEFAIINKTYTYSASANGFSLNVRPPYPSNVPTNWKSPDDYWNGKFYAYYEIIDIPTDQPFEMQMGIFQYYPSKAEWDGDSYRETCSYTMAKLQGEGDIVKVDYGTPSQWWQHPTGAVDFTKVYDFESVGPVFWSRTPDAFGILYPPDEAAWAVRSNYFPCTIKVIIVAVSAGSTFSGWDYWLNGGGTVPAKPTYGIDYENERTNKVVSTSDKYSFDNSTWYNGTGNYLTLTPGEDVYFKTCTSSCSDVQTLDVPSRPPAPSFAFDYATEKTTTVVSSDYEYSTHSDMSSATTGNGSNAAVTPGTNLYFRKLATVSAFRSAIQTLAIPARPSGPVITIDYLNETTAESLPSTIEYATDASMNGAEDGNGTRIALTPGTDLYFRTKATGTAFLSSISTLDVPERPQAPAVTINYTNETTSAVAATLEWSENASMASAVAGSGSSVAVTPGVDLYFRSKATSGSFLSAVQHLDVPGRPAAPVYSIDYANEKTSIPVSSGDDYSLNSDFSGAVAGTNSAITVTPGTTLYFRTRATGSSFRSAIQSLDVPQRPHAPVFTIDFVREETAETVASNVEYSTASDISGAMVGTGDAVPVVPDQDLYFRQKTEAESFTSSIYHLDVPGRNLLGYSGEDTITSDHFFVFALLLDGITGFELDDVQVTNGTAQNLRDGDAFDVYPESTGIVSVVIPANATAENTFVSNLVEVYYNPSTSVRSTDADQEFSIHPNPCRNGIVYIQTGITASYSVEVISNTGKIMKRFDRKNGEDPSLDLGELPEGLYFLKFNAPGSVNIQKLILQ